MTLCLSQVYLASRQKHLSSHSNIETLRAAFSIRCGRPLGIGLTFVGLVILLWSTFKDAVLVVISFPLYCFCRHCINNTQCTWTISHLMDSK